MRLIKNQPGENEEMKITLQGQGVIETQELDLSDDVMIIYGYNNCGKTTMLKLINQFCDRQAIENLFLEKDYQLSMYIPTNRVVVSSVFTELKDFRDTEDIINYKRSMYDMYDLHLKMIRDYLLGFDPVRGFIAGAVSRMFDTEISDFAHRYSDGIENIINIYVNIIWILAWDKKLSGMEQAAFKELMGSSAAYILIDEIEMFLHVCVQSRLINSLKTDFPQCRFIFSTHSPLLLTRYRDSRIYQLEDGKLHQVHDDLYFKDLDSIYESCFHVAELPDNVKADINYLGSVILGEELPDSRKIEASVSDLKKNYPNLYRKYNKLIVKAKDRAER